MTINPHHLTHWEEIHGPVLDVEEAEGYCIALIGKISVLLPLDMAEKLREQIGNHIGILRTDIDYRFRVSDKRRS
jgi:hypothetical protein